jgi:hypothetical protein
MKSQAKLQSSANWLMGGGEMGERIRNFNWRRTPLGPIDQWPQSLRTAVSLIQARWCPVQDDEHRSGKICRQRAQQLADGCDPPGGTSGHHDVSRMVNHTVRIDQRRAVM